jgi:predicted Fe-Mo cluster-binding NifX family protein
MKIAVPIWEDKVSPVLDTAAKLLIVETLNRNEIGRTESLLDELEISRRCFRISKLKIDVLICGAISRPFSERLAAAGINIIPGISGAVEEIVAAYFSGTLNQSKYSMPGCRQKQIGPNEKPLPFKKSSKRTRKKN